MRSLSLILCFIWKHCSVSLIIFSWLYCDIRHQSPKCPILTLSCRSVTVTSEMQAALLLIWLWGLSCLQTGQWFWVDWAGHDCSPAASQNWPAMHLCFWLPQEKQAKRGITRNWADVQLCWLSQMTYWKSFFSLSFSLYGAERFITL